MPATGPGQESDRTRVAQRAADALAAGAAAGLPAALVGFDGFIDAIIDAVDQRLDMSPTGYRKFTTIGAFARRLADAAGHSTNVEFVVRERRFGGNGPLLAGALGRLGAPVTFIGCVGQEDDPSRLHPIYAPLGERCRRVIPLAPPAHTDSLEFSDGKLMFGKPDNLQRIDWDELTRRVGLDELRRLVRASRLIAVVNWVMMGGVERIWEGLIRDVLAPRRSEEGPRPARRVFIDLCDPAKRSDADLSRALGILRRMNDLAPVTLGLNVAEAARVARLLGVACPAPATGPSDGDGLAGTAAAVRERAGLSCVAIHPRDGAAAADEHGQAWFLGPFTRLPRLSTGGGDHFNAGFALAQCLGLPLGQCLAAGCATSGAYVRDAESPTLDRLVAFLRSLPDAEP